MWGCEYEVGFAGTVIHRGAVDRIHPVLSDLAERLQRNRKRKPCRFSERTLLGVVLLFPVLAVSDYPFDEVSRTPNARSRVAGRDALKVKIQSVTLITDITV